MSTKRATVPDTDTHTRGKFRMPTKAMTLRLAEEKAQELEAVARADEMPVSDAVRAAIEGHIERRRSDKVFQDRLQRILDEDREVFERLGQS